MIFKCRRIKRIINFSEWLFINFINEKGLFNLNKLNKLQKQQNNPIKNYQNLFNFKNINISSFWNFGLKFFFSQNYGFNNYKEQVDIFDLFNIKLKLINIIFLFKKNSIFISKLLNIFLIKTAWKNKKFIRKNIFSHKILKLKFLTGFYNYLSKNWRGTDNYFFQRYLTSRIYKTYLKNTKLRFNKFILYFVKFFYLKKFIEYRGFWSNFCLNLINNINFLYISISYCSTFFKNIIYNPIIKNNIIKNKKINILNKWNNIKYQSKIFIKKYINSKIINKYKKYYIYYKNYNKYNTFFIKKSKKIFIYNLFFFNFSLWNNTLKKLKRNTNNLDKRIKYINNLKKNFISIFLNNKVINQNKFKFIRNRKIIFFKYLKLFKKYYFSISYNLGYNLDSIEFLRINLKKIIFNNIKTLQYNKKILNWDKQKKFLYIKNKRWFINSKDKIIWKLYKPYKINKFLKKLYYNKLIYYNKYFKLNNKNNLSNKNKQKNYKFHLYLNNKNLDLNKKRFIKKYKNYFLLKHNFYKNFKNNYYLYLQKTIYNYKKYLNIYLNNNFYNFRIKKFELMNKNNYNIFIFKNIIYKNNWKFNKKYYYYLINEKKNNNKINYFIILISCYINFKNNKFFW